MVGSVSKCDEGQPALGEAGNRRGGLGHLHQRKQPFLHPRTTRGGHADEGQALFKRSLDATHKTLANHRAHRSAQKLELEAGDMTGTVLIAPCTTTSASASPVSSLAAARRSG
jgi:hypothetical protein